MYEHLDSDLAEGRLDRIRETLNLVVSVLCDLVPSRVDIHARISSDCADLDMTQTQTKLIEWIQRFHAPLYDPKTQAWLKRVPMPISEFLTLYLPHLELVLKQKINHKPTFMASGR